MAHVECRLCGEGNAVIRANYVCGQLGSPPFERSGKAVVSLSRCMSGEACACAPAPTARLLPEPDPDHLYDHHSSEEELEV
ncbi:hypothetical protein EVAR_8425_1 [Eumeta japonica]|uniref:Uncharacterized protein n=1 Tax=Eumeta variegata TaxID=151549 RepID=A0A4C1WFB0_EUMVA|nr:hypothetical protein EVAR_8425_1 [Eumeta japonica]